MCRMRRDALGEMSCILLISLIFDPEKFSYSSSNN